jgi:UDP-N-acetylmuramoyl-tripeptide--D-alanyl-D-alanine ligase
MALPATPIGRAVLDSRDVQPGDLFVALAGQQTDGHAYVGAALAAGASAVICEVRGREQAAARGAALIDCTRGRWSLTAKLPAQATAATPIAYLVDDAEVGLQNAGGFQRVHRTRDDLRVIGITGSVGKTSTKELTAAVIKQRFITLATPGNLNNEQGLPLTLLGLNHKHERAVLEMGMYDTGEISRLCELGRPHVGVVTNVGPSHLSRLGSIERIQQAKSELPQALPAADDGGVAILNWDDERVRTMVEVTKARIFRYGLTSEADLWADEIESGGMDGIRFRFHHRKPNGQVDSLHVRVPLLGRHSVHTALRAAAVGLVEGLGWDEIVSGMQGIPGQLRLVVMPGINGSTIIDDTYNASPASTIAALNLLADLKPEGNGRRVAVLGDMLELGHFTDEGHKLVGRRAADVVDVLVTVGGLGKAIGAEAGLVGYPQEQLHSAPTAEEAIALLQTLLRTDDAVLVKGSRAIGMEQVVNEIVVR